jgi:hypothetical protein
MCWVSWSRRGGRAGSYKMRPASVGGMATIARFAFTARLSVRTVTLDEVCSMRRTGAFSTKRLPSVSWVVNAFGGKGRRCEPLEPGGLADFLAVGFPPRFGPQPLPFARCVMLNQLPELSRKVASMP